MDECGVQCMDMGVQLQCKVTGPEQEPSMTKGAGKDLKGRWHTGAEYPYSHMHG
jgi:hypothetical protein